VVSNVVVIVLEALRPSYPERVVACHTMVPVLPFTTTVEVIRVEPDELEVIVATVGAGDGSPCATGAADLITEPDTKFAPIRKRFRKDNGCIIILWDRISLRWNEVLRLCTKK